MFRAPYHPRSDPELDPPRENDPRRTAEFARDHARLIANPFLAIIGWILACSLMRSGLKSHNLPLSLASLFGFSISFLLIQYHCLDCGATGWAIRTRRHLCLPATARGSAAGSGRSSGPSLTVQIKVWIALVIFAAIYYLLNAVTHR